MLKYPSAMCRPTENFAGGIVEGFKTHRLQSTALANVKINFFSLFFLSQTSFIGAYGLASICFRPANHHLVSRLHVKFFIYGKTKLRSHCKDHSVV